MAISIALQQDHPGGEVTIQGASILQAGYATGLRDNPYDSQQSGLGGRLELRLPRHRKLPGRRPQGAVKTHDFLHVGDGRVYEIELAGSTARLADRFNNAIDFHYPKAAP